MGKNLPRRPFAAGESDVPSVSPQLHLERTLQRRLAAPSPICPWILWQLIHLIREFMVASK